MGRITSLEELRALYPAAHERALKKQLSHIDRHCRRFIELSPFVVMSSRGADGLADASPRGDQPGFVHVQDETTLVIPDWPGNNRLDTLSNIVADPAIGLLFLIPGVDDVLRVNGEAELRTDEELRALFERSGKLPRLVVRMVVREAYLHCPKALIRAKLWDPAAQIERSQLPSLLEMIHDQIKSTEPAESQADMVARLKKVLY
ncbi:pyridoxamine 5'-phosphate oxidase family protein [Leptospira interrogans]